MRRRTYVWIAASVATVLISVALVSVVNRRSTVDIPDEGPWTVVVDADPSAFSECLNDPAVANSLMNPMIPAPGISLTLIADATKDDVKRLVGCIVERVPSSTVKVTS